MTCQTCKHWMKPQSNIVGNRLGNCRRYPPTMMLVPTPQGAGLQPIWTITGPLDVCGEHARSSSAPAPEA